MKKLLYKGAKSSRETMLTTAILVCILLGFAGGVTLAEEPLYGGTLIIAKGTNIRTFVQIFEAAGVWRSCFMLYDRLVETDITGEVHPALAETWDISDDGLTYTFHLRDDVKWHDGVKFTSADVKFTYEEIIRLQGVGYLYVKGIDNIETPDDYTVVITLKTPDAAFLPKLCDWGGKTHIIAKHIYEGTDWRTNPATTTKPIGTGPWKFVEFVSGDHLTLEANDDYWQGRPYLDELITKIIPDKTVQQLALEAGELGFMLDPPPLSEVARLINTPGIGVKLIPHGEDQITLFYNLQREPFDNLKVRQAIAHAIDKKTINDLALAGYCHAADVVYATEFVKLRWATNPDAKFPEFNPALAEQLLDEAGFPRGTGGVRFRTTLNTFTIFPEMGLIMDLVKEDLAAVGIECTATLLEYLTWWSEVQYEHNFDLTINVGHSGPDPYIMGDFFQTGMWRNIGEYSNTTFDNLMDQAIIPLDKTERATYYHQAWEILADDLPYVQLTTFIRTFPYRTEYHGFYIENPTQGAQWKFNKVWWEEATPLSPPTKIPIEYVVIAAVVVVCIVIVGATWVIKRK